MQLYAQTGELVFQSNLAPLAENIKLLCLCVQQCGSTDYCQRGRPFRSEASKTFTMEFIKLTHSWFRGEQVRAAAYIDKTECITSSIRQCNASSGAPLDYEVDGSDHLLFGLMG